MKLNKFWQKIFRPLLGQTWLTIIALALIFIFTIAAFTFNQFTANFQNFVYQAEGFIQGTPFYHTLPPNLHDSSVFEGQYYWAPGPLPAIILMPLVAIFGLIPLQVYLSMLLVIVVLGLAYKLARQAEFNLTDSLWLALAFTFASIYLGVAFRAQAWQVSSALAATAVLWLLLEYKGKNRPWLIGLVAAAALATRVTAGLVFLLPVVSILFTSKQTWSEKISWLGRALAPVVLAGVILLGLNYARTGSWWQTGYTSAQVSSLLAEVRQERGLLAWQNIPTNIYFYFLVPPRPVFAPGTYQLQPPYVTANVAMGFFFLSPIFLYLWRLRLRDSETKLVVLVAASLTLLILSYYALNTWEFGPRYLVDVLPLYYLLLLRSFPDRRLLGRDYWLIALSAWFNFYLFTTIPWWTGS